MRVLGIDPGLTRCGLGVVGGAGPRGLEMLHVEVIRTAADLPVSDRLLAIFQALGNALDTWQPDAVAVERVFAQANVRTVMGTAQVSGLAIVAAAERGIPVRSYTPTEVKAAVTGSGKADKAQVAEMVRRILNLSAAPKPADAADSLAIAICQAWRGTATDRIAAAMAANR